MTAVLDDAPATASARAAIEPRDAWRKARGPLAIGLGFVLVALVHALLAGGQQAGRLDPEGTREQGARALATLLRDHGVDVRVVESPSGAAATTVFVPFPAVVAARQPHALAAARFARTLVVAEPDDEQLETLDVDAEFAAVVEEKVVEPRCAHPDAVAAGPVLMGGVAFGAAEYATVCYAHSGGAPFVELEDGARHVTLLGSGSFMTNEHLDDDGNAALAMRLLTRHPTVEWVYPRESAPGADDGEEGAGLLGLLPHRVLVFTAQAFVVLLLLALWRGRRLGPVVVEPLPVVVRAAEAVEGRARLYEGAHARDQAANALRAGLRDRLVRVLGLAPDASPETMVAAVTARTGRDAVGVSLLLYGPPPADDAALVRLAADLDQLDNEVRAL